ncbi:MAG: 4Fe-4S binding protein [Coriobacteriales bacterium]|jgi:ferredoxin|nr:4Fe-4S binding protein [Coriobacteriales bacterium]
MDKPVLTPDIIKRCNPGVNDFGLGQLMALASQCLRSAKTPTACDICLDVCPVGALASEKGARPHATTACIKCGVCISACPVNALAGSLRTIQQINRLILQATLRVDRLAITCERTCALLRLKQETDAADEAERDLALIDAAVKSEHLYKVPCLGMLSREIWFSALSEIGFSRLHELLVYLPVGQCDNCPANALGTVEDAFSRAIAIAEEWSGETVGLVMDAAELPQARHANVRAYLMSETEVDRRGVFTGFVEELKASWDESTRVGNRALDETQRQRVRKQTFERTRLWAVSRAPKLPGKQPIATPLRYILIEAVGRHPQNAKNVRLITATTDDELCTRCGACVDACPVHTRRLIEGEAATAGTEATEAADAEGAANTAAAAEATDATPSFIMTDSMYCMACSACLQVCPTKACHFDETDGSTFLLDQDSSGQ